MKAFEEAIFKVVRDVLLKCDGDINESANELGLSPRTIRNYLLKWPELEQFVKRKPSIFSEGNEKWRRLGE